MTTLRHCDLRHLGYCNRGARDWCRAHGIDWRQLVREGIPVALVEGIDDDLVRAAIERARVREACHA